jgi:tripartite-type tricarboxylate transporter receptor subunit TctC
MKVSLRAAGVVLCGLACAAAKVPEAGAQAYPARPIRLIVPFSAGGAADVPGRILTQRITEVLGQQVIVENRPGAGSSIGAEAAARAAPDGYTLLMISNTHFVTAALHPKLAYDPLNDYTPITQVTSAPNVLVVHPSLPVKSVKELIALAKAKPGQIDYASSGQGSTQHLTGALFCAMAGIQMTHIPYRGSGPVTADLLEAGVKGYEMVAWFGLAAPKGLSREIQAKLHGETLRVLKNPDLQKSLAAAGQEVAWQDTPERFFEFLKVESVKWAKVVKDSGAKLE